LNNIPFKLSSSSTEIFTPIEGFESQGLVLPDGTLGTQIVPTFGPERAVSGFRLVDSRASYGIGLTTLVIGFPAHFDWSWRTLFNKDWEDVVFATQGGSEEYRKPRFDFWIGYDF
jgi:hypothetical protein